MGVFLSDRKTGAVSMNLTDYESTPIGSSLKQSGANRRYGVSVAGSEIVGLIPQKALDQTSVFYLRVEISSGNDSRNRLEDVIARASSHPQAWPMRCAVSSIVSPHRNRFPAAECRRTGGSAGCGVGTDGHWNHERQESYRQ